MTTPNGLTHPAADLFPMLEGGELADLAADIAQHGLRHPITLMPDGTLLDGRNRSAACTLAEVAPTFTTYEGDDPIGYVVSENVKRRHLNPTQLGVLALDVEKERAKEARPRMLAGVRATPPSADPGATWPQGRAPKASDLAAAEVGASGRAVRRAKRVAERATFDPEAAELLAGMRAGTVDAGPAERIVAAKERTERREAALAALDEPDDMARLDALGIKVQPYDVWNFAGCHDAMGSPHPGRIPGELVCHALYFLTDPGAIVVDPMAGSGTTLDACRLMGREGHGFDIDLRHGRPDVAAHDLSTGWPTITGQADLVFWDPPYYDKMDNSTIGGDGYIEGSISGLDPDQYLTWLADRFVELYKATQAGTRLAFLMSDWDPENAKRYANFDGLFLWDYADAMRGAGWQLRRQIQCPLPTQQVHPDIVLRFRDARRMARLGRYLLVAER